jgi:hypothetical protein
MSRPGRTDPATSWRDARQRSAADALAPDASVPDLVGLAMTVLTLEQRRQIDRMLAELLGGSAARSPIGGAVEASRRPPARRPRKPK